MYQSILLLLLLVDFGLQLDTIPPSKDDLYLSRARPVDHVTFRSSFQQCRKVNNRKVNTDLVNSLQYCARTINEIENCMVSLSMVRTNSDALTKAKIHAENVLESFDCSSHEREDMVEAMKWCTRAVSDVMGCNKGQVMK